DNGPGRVPFRWGRGGGGKERGGGTWARAWALRRPWGPSLLAQPLPPRASFSSQPASLPVPLPAGPREPDWARGVEQQLRLPPPDVPTRSAAGSHSAQT